MKSEQLSIFVENRAGRLAEIIQTLGDAGINIRALSLADTSDFGILRIMVCDNARAAAILAERGFTFGRTAVLAVEISDEPGALAELLQLLARYSINIEYMYAYSQRALDRTIMIFRFDKTDDAVEVLQENGVTVIPPEILCSF